MLMMLLEFFQLIYVNILYEQESAFEKSQKYKEGKFILERYVF
jgi:hypothetical protein